MTPELGLVLLAAVSSTIAAVMTALREWRDWRERRFLDEMRGRWRQYRETQEGDQRDA